MCDIMFMTEGRKNFFAGRYRFKYRALYIIRFFEGCMTKKVGRTVMGNESGTRIRILVLHPLVIYCQRSCMSRVLIKD